MQTVLITNDSDFIIIVGDLNIYVGKQHDSYSNNTHRDYRYNAQNEEGKSNYLDFCDINDIIVCNANFRKSACHLIVN